MSSLSVINESISAGPEYSSSYTVPDDVTSGVVTSVSIYPDSEMPANGTLFLNGIPVASVYSDTAGDNPAMLIRVGLVAGDVVKVYCNFEGGGVNVTANLTKS